MTRRRSKAARTPRQAKPSDADLPQRSARRGRLLWGGLLIVALAVAAYGPTYRAGYIWDDDDYLTDNVHVRTASGLGKIWFEIGATTQYYPLVYTTFWAEYHLWGLEPFGYHLVNVLLHAGGAVLLWRVLRRLSVPGAWFAAAVFALHPVGVMSVAWVTERKNVLSGVFYFAALLAYLRFAGVGGSRPEGRRRGGFYALAVALAACALLSKTVTCTLPATILLVLWWKNRRLSLRDVAPTIPMFAISVCMGLLTAWVERTAVGAQGQEWALSFGERFLLSGRILWFYLAKLLWPAGLTFIYPRWVVDAGVWWQYLFPLAAVALPLVLWRLRGRFGRGPLVASLFFGGTLFPALGFFDVYMMRFSYVTDHWQYLASVGPIAAVAALIVALLGLERRGGSAVLVPILLLAALGTLTWRQCRVYKNEEALWRHTLANNPSAWIAHNNLGLLLKNDRRADEAERHYLQALEHKPDFVDAHNNLGALLVDRGDYAEAIDHYRLALAEWPEFAPTHFNLGKALFKQGRFGDAIDAYRRAVKCDDKFAAAHNELGVALDRLGLIEEATASYNRALALDPGSAKAHNNLAVVLAERGYLERAIGRFREALRLDPDLVEAWGGLGATLAMQGETAEAIVAWRRAVEIDPGNVRVRCLLADHLIQLGRVDEAVVEYREALRIDPNYAAARRGLQLAKPAPE